MAIEVKTDQYKYKFNIQCSALYEAITKTNVHSFSTDMDQILAMRYILDTKPSHAFNAVHSG